MPTRASPDFAQRPVPAFATWHSAFERNADNQSEENRRGYQHEQNSETDTQKISDSIATLCAAGRRRQAE